MTKPLTKPLTKPVIKPVTIFDKYTKNGQCVVEAVVSVSVTVSAESIGQLEFRFRYRTETKIVVSVVHYEVGRWYKNVHLLSMFIPY